MQDTLGVWYKEKKTLGHRTCPLLHKNALLRLAIKEGSNKINVLKNALTFL